MHYYQFHIGDYRASTAHLSNEEDLAYRRLLDMYYDTEQPIPLDTQWVARRLRVDTQVIANVLKDMFTATDSGWTHERCEAEIEHYQHLAERNRANGRKGGRPKKPSGLPVETQIEPRKTLTNNQEPTTNSQTKNKAVVTAAPDGVSQEVWESFLQQRKASRAVVTPTVVKKIAQEAQKAGWTLENALAECVARGWRGFKADWVAEKQAKNVGERNRDLMQGLTRGLIGGGKNVQLLK
jgi:uncharacterized protein YdaU (DUF1376 family)